MLAAIPTTHHSLFADGPVLEYDRSSHPFRRQLIAAPIAIDATSMVQIPNGPGLRIEIDRYIVALHSA